MLAVNFIDYDNVCNLIQCHANPFHLTVGINIKKKKFQFPLSKKNTLEFDEDRNGKDDCRYNALHIACCMKINKKKHKGKYNTLLCIVKKLVEYKFGSYSSSYDDEDDEWYCLVDSRVEFVNDEYGNVDYKCIEGKLNTPLHLCKPNSDIASILMNDGNASLLTQNLYLEVSWERHRKLLPIWLLHNTTMNLQSTVVMICKAKNIPLDCSLYIIEFYISLHLLEHYERAMKQETSEGNLSFMASSLSCQDDEDGETVYNKLSEIKMASYKELFDEVISQLYKLHLFDDANHTTLIADAATTTAPSGDAAIDPYEHEESETFERETKRFRA